MAVGTLTHKLGRRYRTGALGMLLLLLAFQGTVHAWELRVCAEPNNMPFSNDAREGFENRIARIIAQELRATLAYQWLPASRASDRLLYLRRGDCDMVIGVGDGTEGYLSTVTYYQSAPVFVYRKDAPFDVASFDDDILRDLSIGVLAGVGVRPEVAALANRELMRNVVSFSWEADRPAPLAAPVEAVAAGELDIAVLWGPVGSYFAERHEVDLEVVPAEPKLDLPFLNLVVPMVMGVRLGDEALRDLLNEAIAGSWDEIQAVLNDFDVPLEPLTPPVPAPADSGDGRLRVGFALPLATGAIPIEADAVHEAAAAARLGAVMAEEELGGGSESFAGLELLISNTPNAASARRAAERMVANGAVALVGGYGQGQAQELAGVAASLRVPFLNIGTASQSLREECQEFTFHVEADEAMYLSALAASLNAAGLNRWFVAFPDTEQGRTLFEMTEAAAVRAGSSEVVGSTGLSSEGQLMQVVLEARETEAQVIVALLDWRAQLDLAGFVNAVGEGLVMTGFPDPTSQTRTFYYSLRGVGSSAEGIPRVALWDAALDDDVAGELNKSFFERWGVPMDSPAWAAYVSMELIRQGAEVADQSTGLAAVLPDLEVDLNKGATGSFDPSSHQLQQPLYGLLLDTDAESRESLVSVSARLVPDEAFISNGATCR